MSGGKRRRAEITLTVDGVEIAAEEGTMLVDAAKSGDVEIPVFCYEPKLGDPVGACRMCLVEIEGVPKLQAGCATPVRDGMVVYTRSEPVTEAQNAVVEFLLANHPLDCPVCDKGGECPLQDISMGWGAGKSRFTDPKRHFQKPIPLSPLIRIDRERCILCYRCVRFSQEVSEDEQLQLLERGAGSYVGTHADRPYVAPFHGNIIELCPVGALTSETYRFRARPWDIEDAGSVCTLCPAQCNVKFSVRDERVARVLARDNEAVDDGWLCDKGRFGFQMFGSPDRPTGPRIREAGSLREASWEEALDAAAPALRSAGERTAVIVGGATSNEEGYLLQRIARRALSSPHVDSRPGGVLSREAHAALAAPELSIATSELDDAEAICVLGVDPMHAMPIVDLRIRKAVRRNGCELSVATERPTTLDGGTAPDRPQLANCVRYSPGEATGFLDELLAALDGADNESAAIAASLRDAERKVIVWGERIAHGPDREAALERLLAVAEALDLGDAAGSGLYEIPDATNARGLREVGCLPGVGPGLVTADEGMGIEEIREALESDQLDAVVLWNVDPVRDFPDPEGWTRAIGGADFTLSVSMFGTASAQNADIHLPAETHAEKHGTVTHPDGRLQRMRPSVPHPDKVRPLWLALVELAARLGEETGFQSAGDVLEGLAEEAGIYGGITHDEIGGRGVRWQSRPAASGLVEPGAGGGPPEAGASRQGSPSAYPSTSDLASGGPPPAPGNGAPDGNTEERLKEGKVRLGTYRDLWAGEVAERNPALRFLAPEQTLDLSPADAKRLGVGNGDAVEVAGNGHAVNARVAVRARMREGTAFLIEGLAEDNATLLKGAGAVEVRPVGEFRNE